MKLFKEKIDEKGAEAFFYLQEPIMEIDPERKSPVMIIVPGGAYMWVSEREGEPIAAEYYARGFSCVVLKYATEGRKFFKENTYPEKIPVSVFPNPLVALGLTIAKVRSKAHEWNLDPQRIVVAGFSAGGNLAGQISVFWNEMWLSELTDCQSEMLRPDATILAYPMLDCLKGSERARVNEWVNRAMLGNEITETRLREVSPIYHVGNHVPPTFIWHTMEDTFVPVTNSLEYAIKLQENRVPYEMHIYQKGEHGIALGDKRTDSMPDHSQVNSQGATWVELSVGWMKEIGILD